MRLKKLPVLLIFPVSIILFTGSGGMNPVKDGPYEDGKMAIPENLKEVFMRSCKPCHWEGGKFKSLFHVNFSKWDNYSSSRQANKAEKICSELKGEDMPPESFRKSRPNLIPTDEQINAVCKWASALNIEK
jgi:hypothetical protein